LDVGANTLAGTDPERNRQQNRSHAYRKSRLGKNQFGDGKAGQKIINILKEEFAEIKSLDNRAHAKNTSTDKNLLL